MGSITQAITAKASAYWMDGFSLHPFMATLDTILASQPLVGIQIAAIDRQHSLLKLEEAANRRKSS